MKCDAFAAPARAFLLRAISLAGWVALQSMMDGTPVLLAQEEGGPVYPSDKDVGGGAP